MGKETINRAGMEIVNNLFVTTRVHTSAQVIVDIFSSIPPLIESVKRIICPSQRWAQKSFGNSADYYIIPGRSVSAVQPAEEEEFLRKVHVFQGDNNCRSACIRMNRRFLASNGRPKRLPCELYNSAVETVIDPGPWRSGKRMRGPVHAERRRLANTIESIERAIRSGYLPPVLVSHKNGLHYVCVYQVIRDCSGRVVALKYIDPGSANKAKRTGLLVYDERFGNFVKKGRDRGNVPDFTYYLLGVYPIDKPQNTA